MLNKQKLLYDLFQAYYDARKNKRNTLNQLDFEFNLEENLINLGEELFSGKYEVGRSIYFIQNHPVKREVFAGDFRDRVVHHLIYNYISPIFEKEFIYDSYSCRKGKGTSLGIKRVSKFIRSCSENYTKDCYVLKLDISGYFMSINKDILFEKIERVLKKKDCHYLAGPDNLVKSNDEGNRSPGQARGGQGFFDKSYKKNYL
ncbi:MAG: reverse transcriptase domain-containing protein [Candidatus Gracilibacteria bacterium]|nr:reverse transcriptase domain-containing protein [Candidatus Gracilibacteria bacterium]